MSQAVQTAKGWDEWVEFMVKTHQYMDWDVRISKQFEFLQKFLQRLPPGGKILDVGAGQCEAKRFFEDYRYVSVDAAVGDEDWDYSNLDIVSNVQRLPFRSGSFDGAINIWVAEHVRDPIGMVGEVARILKPGGQFMIFLPFVVHEHQLPHDYFRFTRFGAAALLEDNGFEEIEVVPDSSVGFAVAYESVKNLNSIRNAAGLPPEWKGHVESCLQVVWRMVKDLSAQKDFPSAAPGLSYLAMARKPENWAGAARPSNTAGWRVQRAAAPGTRNGTTILNTAGAAAAPRLNVGCGNQKMPGWLGIDRVRTEAADIVRDITRGLPFADSSVAEIYCDNVLEHIGPSEDFVFVLNEFYRVLKPDGIATIIVPDGRSQAAWQDPTHQRAFVPRSALYWNQDLQWPKLYGITADFDVELQEYGDPETEAFLKFVCKARPKQLRTAK